MGTYRLCIAPLLCSLFATVVTAPAVAGRLEDTLRSRWLGAWVLLKAEATSDCDGSYSNTPVEGGRILSRGAQRFGVGELGRVDNLHVQRQRIDVLIGLAEPLLIAFSDGPFDLVRQEDCAIELQFAVPRSLVKDRDADAIDQILGSVLERHASKDQAVVSSLYNGRRVEPFPADWEETLAAYEVWRQEQLGRLLVERLGEAMEESVRITNRVKTSPAYGHGLAAGMRGYYGSLSGDDCVELAEKSFYPSGGSVPDDYSGSSKTDWKSGYRDGQRLAFNVDLGEGLLSCLR